METLSAAVARLQADGYTGNWFADDGGWLVCETDGARFDTDHLTVEAVVRFEGASDPADESILYAITSSDGHKGLYSTTFGPETPPGDVAVVRAIGAHRR